MLNGNSELCSSALNMCLKLINNKAKFLFQSMYISYKIINFIYSLLTSILNPSGITRIFYLN